jgi:factor associated with neutral sphingomyelinase activation
LLLESCIACFVPFKRQQRENPTPYIVITIVMTVSSWFRSSTESSNLHGSHSGANNNINNNGSTGGGQLSVKEAVQVLYPIGKTISQAGTITTGGGSGHHHHGGTERNGRFSQLLLEHGERPLQDWAVVAHSTPAVMAMSTSGTNLADAAAAAAAAASIHEGPHSRTNVNNSTNRDGIIISAGGAASISSNSNSNTSTIQWEQSPFKRANQKARSRDRLRSQQQHQLGGGHKDVHNKDAYPSAHMSKLEGRLHLCTKSLVFEPTNTSRAVIRCPYSKMERMPVEHPSEAGFESMCIQFTAKRHVVMKINNMIGPFAPVHVPCRFQFTFLHSSPTAFVELCQKLFQVRSQDDLEALIRPILDRPFGIENFVDVREQLLTNYVRCSILTPLQTRPGTFGLTNERLYFQGATSTESWLQRNVVATARRYHGLRDSALEIYWRGGGGVGGCSTLFAFDRRHDRECVLRYLNANVPCFSDRDFVVEVVHEWCQGKISNYEYLLALNSAAGRSFHDLSRYPVFPWVIGDYVSTKLDLTKESTFRDLSKPVGALNEQRLEYFQTRLKSMQDMEEAFLYGTHYSAPGYVLYFLVRSMPEHMLCLQNGKFDSPDRMFHSVSRCFSCALTNHADVKELIPEFYNAGHDFDFLINAKGLQLGATQTGDRVNDVKLPPWARSPRDFIKKNRKALESDVCTRTLPMWIDLIFGCKSRGEQALEANNLFHHNAYLGPTDLAGMQTEEERFQAELQATEFGIVPDMLFRHKHISRGDAFDDNFISLDIGRASSKDDPGSGGAWELLDAPTNESEINVRIALEQPENDEGGPADVVPDNTFQQQHFSLLHEVTSGSEMNTPSQNMMLSGTGEGRNGEQLPKYDQGFSSPDPSKSQPSSPQRQDDSPRVQQTVEASSSGWNMKVLERKSIHSDAVSGCALVLNKEKGSGFHMLVTTSLDGGLIVNKLSLEHMNSDQGSKTALGLPFTRFSYTTIISRAGGQVPQALAQSKLTEYRTHSSRDPLASLVLASDDAGGTVAFAGGHDDVVLAYGIKSACAVASVYSHRDAVTGLDLVPRSPFGEECILWTETSTHILVSGSWDATVKVWSVTVASGETVSVNREPLAEFFDADASIVCVSAKSVPNGGIAIAAGCADGSFCVWNLHSDGVQVLIHKEQQSRKGSGPCSVMQWASSHGNLYLFAAFATGKLVSYSLNEGTLQRVNAVSLGVPITSLAHTEGILLVGCSDGGIRLVPMRDSAYFDSKPTLWTAVNNKSTSPGISSLSLTITRDGNCICCSGAEDGSVLLFDLKKEE